MVEAKNSLIIAGLDPAPSSMRDKNSLSEGVDLEKWCLDYLVTVKDYVVGVKCNPGYFQSVEGLRVLKIAADFCKQNNLISILDYKISDIGSTNEAWVYFTKELGFDAVTIAPYAGNLESAIDSSRKHDLGVISMGIMSNPEFAQEADFEKNGEKLFINRVKRSLIQNVDGLVLGATYKSDSVFLREFISYTKDSDVLFLVPGIGSQGGTVDGFLDTMLGLGVDPKRCMLNVGRNLMFPENVTQKEEAKRLQLLSAKYISA